MVIHQKKFSVFISRFSLFIVVIEISILSSTIEFYRANTQNSLIVDDMTSIHIQKKV